MHKINSSWVKGGVIALLLFVSVVGCTENEKKAASIGAAGAGSILVLIPDPSGICQTVGIIMIAGGTIGCVTLELQDGTKKAVQIKLTPDQVEKYKAGAKVEVEIY